MDSRWQALTNYVYPGLRTRHVKIKRVRTLICMCNGSKIDGSKLGICGPKIWRQKNTGWFSQKIKDIVIYYVPLSKKPYTTVECERSLHELSRRRRSAFPPVSTFKNQQHSFSPSSKYARSLQACTVQVVQRRSGEFMAHGPNIQLRV